MSKQRITLYVDSEAWRAFRIRCLREKTSASAVVERWMWALLDPDDLPQSTPQTTPANQSVAVVSEEERRSNGE